MLAACVVLSLVGGGLLACGLVGRRVGQEPRCRRCGYIVHGVESGQCPECGIALVAGTVRVAVRVRRWRPLAAGCFLLLMGAGFGVAVGTGWAARTNLYQYLPTGWVVKAAGRGSVDAMAIVEKRVIADEVKGARLREVIETGLASQGAERTDANTQRWIELLAQVEKHIGMTTEQKERFSSQMVRLDARARPKERKGQDLPIHIWGSLRAPSGRFLHVGGEVEVVSKNGERLGAISYISGHASKDFGGRSFQRLERMAPGLALRTRRLALGWHQVELRVRLNVIEVASARRGMRVLWSGDRTLRAAFELVASDGPDPTVSIDDVDAVKSLRDALELRAILELPAFGQPAYLTIDWRLKRAVACDARLEVTMKARPFGLPESIDPPRRIDLSQGRINDEYISLVSGAVSTCRVGDVLTLQIRSREIDGALTGTGVARLKGGIEFEPIQVVVEAAPLWPTSAPAVAVGAGGT